MKLTLMLILALLGASFCAYGQKVDSSTYDLITSKGNVSIVTKDGECRLIVGARKNPRAALLMGMLPEMAASQMDRITAMGDNNHYTQKRRSILFCGETFFFSISGNGDARRYSFKGMNWPVRFSLKEKDVQAIKLAIMDTKDK